MRILHGLRDPQSRFSLARRLRSERFAFFRSLIAGLPRPIHILDVGGTQDFWETMDFVDPSDSRITLLNLEAAPSRHPNVTTLAGDACDLGRFPDGHFDVVFSNSVIEHVGGLDEQRAMAREVRRAGRRYFVQTPNRYFPIEPHFMFPGFQFLPLGVRTWLLMHFALAWSGRIRDPVEARCRAAAIRLLDGPTFASLFPDARIYRERVLGLTKSFVAYGRW